MHCLDTYFNDIKDNTNIVYFIRDGDELSLGKDVPDKQISDEKCINNGGSSVYLVIKTKVSHISTGTKIFENAFQHDSTIEKASIDCDITMTEQNIVIERSAFEDCSALSEIVFKITYNKQDKAAPEGNKKTEFILEENAFKECAKLQTVILPDCSKTTIKKNVCSGCCKLRTVLIQSEEIEIDDSAFAGCTELTLVGKRDVIGNYAQRNHIHFVEYDKLI